MGVLPLLNSERVRAQSGGVAKRLITMVWGSGVVPADFYAPAGPLGTLPPILAPLDPWKSKVLQIRGRNLGGIDSKVMTDAGNRYGGHVSYPSLLTGTATGTMPSIDTLIAAQLATAGLPKAQLNVGCRPGSTATSWRAGKVKNTPETNPSRLFTTLFAGASVTPQQTNTLLLRRMSVLDHVTSELKNFQSVIGAEDKSKVQAHLDSVRQIEMQLSAGGTSTPGAGCSPPPNTGAGISVTSPLTLPDHLKLMLDLVAAAVKCDMARAVTIDILDNGGANNQTFPWINVATPGFHSIAHNGAAAFTQKTVIDTWFISQVAYLAAALGTNPEGAVTTLDNTSILVLNDMSEGDFHDVQNLPVLIVGSGGGFFKTGVCVQPQANAPHNQLLTSVCHAMGLQVASVGDTYTGDLDSLLKA
ncbi:MAG TPA: DUF1552 domain-containing protein [Polyangia bacterium]|jgi:hypothetical protein|nr:DUF1552 domain-containing protein [Polyangia bacterium]